MKAYDEIMNAAVCIIFLIYTAVVLPLSLFSDYRMALFGIVGLVVCALFLWKSYLKSSESAPPLIQSKKHYGKKFMPLIWFGIVFCCSLLYWLAYYPGGFNLDAYGQWDQAHGVLPYNNWHPITSTLLIQLAISVVDRFDFCIFVQLLIFSISASFLLRALQRIWIDCRILTGIAIFIGLCPAVGLNNICMTKDAQYTILLVNLTTCGINIIFSNGKWLEKKRNVILLSIFSGLAVLVRHNGLLFVVPAYLILLLTHRPQIIKIIIAAVITIAMVLAIKVPLSHYLDVEPHDNIVGEAVGIPMAILANALVNDSDHIPTDAHAFLNEIAADSEWKTHYFPGEWDSCKWVFGGTELLRGRTATEILFYTGETILHCPQTSYESARLNTRIVWEPFFTDLYWLPEVYVEENDVGITEHSVRELHTVVSVVMSLSMIPVLSYLSWNTGFQILMIMLIFCLYYKTINIRKLLLIIPLLLYDGGTMLLLAGPNHRYFYCNAVLYLPIIISLLAAEPCEEVSA